MDSIESLYARLDERFSHITKLLESIHSDQRSCKAHCDSTMSGVYHRLNSLEQTKEVCKALRRDDEVKADRLVQEQQSQGIKATVVASAVATLVAAGLFLLGRFWN